MQNSDLTSKPDVPAPRFGPRKRKRAYVTNHTSARLSKFENSRPRPGSPRGAVEGPVYRRFSSGLRSLYPFDGMSLIVSCFQADACKCTPFSCPITRPEGRPWVFREYSKQVKRHERSESESESDVEMLGQRVGDGGCGVGQGSSSKILQITLCGLVCWLNRNQMWYQADDEILVERGFCECLDDFWQEEPKHKKCQCSNRARKLEQYLKITFIKAKKSKFIFFWRLYIWQPTNVWFQRSSMKYLLGLRFHSILFIDILTHGTMIMQGRYINI